MEASASGFLAAIPGVDRNPVVGILPDFPGWQVHRLIGRRHEPQMPTWTMPSEDSPCA